MTVEDLIARLQESVRTDLGKDAPVYLLIDEQLFELVVDVLPKGAFGPGSVLMVRGKRP